MSPPLWPGPPARSLRPRGRAIRAAAAALGTVLALAAGLLSQAGSARAATPWPAGRGAQVREQVWIAAPLTGTLHPGMAGTAVRTLQQRLAQLHYYPGPVNGRFGTDTLEAVWAFKEVQGLPTSAGADDVDPAMQQALARPRLPRVLVPGGGGTRIEVNLPAEVLVLYAHHQVSLITHISAGGGYYYRCPGGGTCGPALTPDGNYRARLFVAGWLRVALGRMYNPVFFIGTNFAIHGDIPIPLKPASHGCVRVPVDVANVLYQQVRISQGGGTPIYIRGHAPGTVIAAAPSGHSSVPATPAPRVTGTPAPVRVPGVAGLLSPRAAGLPSPRAAGLLSPR
jgi:peptidoglycan hydrolase-like protein with peptidoglycan-binding domain